MEETYERDFKGIWIPKEIWLDQELSIIEKVMLVEINSLDNEKGCFAGNQHFANFFNITTVRVSQIIKRLKDLGYVRETDFDGRKRILKTSFKIFFKADLNGTIKQSYNFDEGSIKENDKQNNTLNNTSNKTVNNKKPSVVSIGQSMYLVKDYHLSSKLVADWGNIDWARVDPDCYESILDFLKYRTVIKSKPINSAQGVHGLINGIRGMKASEVNKKIKLAIQKEWQAFHFEDNAEKNKSSKWDEEFTKIK